MNKDKKPLILVLSGAHGVGKTTLAHQLGVDLQIMLKVNIAPIIKTIKTVLSKNSTVKDLFKYNQGDRRSLRTKLIKNSRFIGKIISAIVNSAEYRGENYIIEGVELLPEFLPMDKILFFYVSISENNQHEIQFKHPNITRLRHGIDVSYPLAVKVDKLISNECKGYPVYQINNIGTPEHVSKKIIKMIKKTYPDYRDRYLWFEK